MHYADHRHGFAFLHSQTRAAPAERRSWHWIDASQRAPAGEDSYGVTFCRTVTLDKTETFLPLIPQLRTYLGGTANSRSDVMALLRSRSTPKWPMAWQRAQR